MSDRQADVRDVMIAIADALEGYPLDVQAEAMVEFMQLEENVELYNAATAYNDAKQCNTGCNCFDCSIRRFNELREAAELTNAPGGDA